MLPATGIPGCSLIGQAGPDALLLWVMTGSALVTIEREVLEVSAGWAVRIPAGLRHAIVTAPGTVAVPIWLTSREDLAGEEPSEGPVLLAVPPDWEPQLVHRFAQSLGYLRSSTAQPVSLFDLLSAAGGERTEGSAALPLPRSDEAFRVAHLILRDPGSRASLAEVCAAAGISTRTLQRRFADETGMSFTAWRSRARLCAAGELLKHNGDVAWVASQVGFDNASSFTRSFRALMGVTPRAFRRRTAQPQPKALPVAAEPIPEASTWPRVNGSHVAVWAYRGSARAIIGEHTWNLAEGDAIIIPAGSISRIETGPDCLLLPVGFRPPDKARIAVDAPRPTHFEASETPYLLHHLIATYTPL